MELDDGVVYQDDPGTSAIMSERVSGLANSIYREFERLIRKYDEDVVKELMPLVVAVLENLDTVFAENQEHEVELELLKEDNEQLITQYEREKALRKHAEEKFIEFEDSQEQEKKDLQNHLESLSSHSRQLELKIKNYADQISRLEEREAELKREYNSLHLRHTEMIHNYMEHVERIRMQQTGGEASDTGTIGRVRKERPLSLGIFPMSGGGTSLTPDIQGRAETPGMEGWRFNNLSNQRSSASLKDELSDLSQGGSKSVTPMSTTASDLALDSHREDGDGFWKNTEVQAVPGTRSVSAGLADNDEKSDVQAIIESTPELDMDLGYKGSSTPTRGIENMAFDRNTESLFEEVSSAGTGLIGDVDEGADLLGMGREVENLIQENVQLLETKNALNVVKNDLIARVDELSCEKEGLQGELDAVLQAKAKLEEKNKELEEELKKVKTEAEVAKQNNNKEEDESDVPTAQRRRFTRVEMARVLMERNQYKERLMELQEAVRWTEMIRASRENSEVAEKKRSSIRQFFSRLFSSSSSSTSSNTARGLPSNVKYNPPSIMKKSNTFSQFPREKSKAFDFLKEEVDSSGSLSRREQKRAQYQHVKAHVANGGHVENKINLPVPVCLRPLEQKDASMKLLCAAGVNLSGGWSCEGSSGLSGEETAVETDASKQRKGSQSSLDQPEQEPKEQEREQTVHVEMSSRVWICTSTHSSTKVMIMDVTRPDDLLDSFYVCNSCVLCIASVPGVLETDYPAGEEIPQDLEAGPDSLLASSNSQGSEDLSRAPSEDGVPAPEEAMEATEEDQESPGQDSSQPGIYTEHVFTDPLGTESSGASTGNDNQRESDQDRDDMASADGKTNLAKEETQRMSSALPTMWLGAQNGCLYVHSSVARWRKCLHAVKLKDSILNIVHVKGRVLVALADGTLAIFHRGLGTGKLGFSFVRITALMVSCNRLWVGTGNGVIISIPLSDSANKTVGAIACRPGGAVRVYGDDTVDGAVTGSYVPYCSMAHAQLCFHGHRDAVKFFATVPGQVIVPGAEGTTENSDSSAMDGKSMLIMSGGEGYIDFRIGEVLVCLARITSTCVREEECERTRENTFGIDVKSGVLHLNMHMWK
ncbi:C-Jun-amino-terminal kinase-interacting 4-like isoform X1 [Labeo rohita]|uniref:C-Jun-amino-terminal kinase-interacting 4-like isoform X1 n=1 Tax=Labeo rohita TaxID=84645 RepID=A0A498MJM8_LABRO|nr:C-Jun-amino-terminal kinase-interacting 4-like isoform X1 [Labeo rohita]